MIKRTGKFVVEDIKFILLLNDKYNHDELHNLSC